MAERKRRRWLGWLIGLVVLIVLLWVGYWFAAKYAADTAIARINGGPVSGATVTCTNPVTGGFPLVIDVRCDRVTATAAGERVTAAIGGIAATAPLYWPGDVAARLTAPLVLNAPAFGVALTTNWSAGNATATADFGGGLKAFGANFNGLSAENADANLGLPLRSASASEAHGSLFPSADVANSFVVRGGATKLALTKTDGTNFPDMDAEARFTLENIGASLGQDPTETILQWARTGGNLKIDRLKLAGVGALITADGSLKLSADGLLNGGVVLRWNSIAALADFIEALVPGSRERAELPLQGLNAVSVPVQTPDGQLQQTALTFTEGRIWLGIFPLPIDPIPPIRF